MTSKGIVLPQNQAEIVPAYHRLRQAMIDKLINGDWAPGSRLPSERQLARETGLCVGTVRKAFETMTQHGYLVRIQGKGTFVAESTINAREVRYYSIRAHLASPDVALSIRVLGRDEAPLSAAPADLRLSSDTITGFLRIRRLFVGKRDNTACPVVVTTSYFPLPLCADLRRVSVQELERVSLYLLAEKYCGVAAARSEELLRAEGACGHVARLLEIPEGTPIICAQMQSFSARGHLRELRESHIRTNPFGLVRSHTGTA